MFCSTKNTKFLWILNNLFHYFSKTKWNKISSYRTHHAGSKSINKWNTTNVFIMNKGKHFQKYDLNTWEKRKCNHKMSSKTCRIDRGTCRYRMGIFTANLPELKFQKFDINEPKYDHIRCPYCCPIYYIFSYLQLSSFIKTPSYFTSCGGGINCRRGGINRPGYFMK